MSIFTKLRIKDATLSAVSEIAESLKWNYEYMLNQKKEILQEIVDKGGEVSEDLEMSETLLDAKLEAYDKVFSLLEKL